MAVLRQLLCIGCVWTFILCATPIQDCRTVSVNESLSLQLALYTLLHTQASNGSTICSRIELPSGVHIISSQTWFPAEVGSFKLVGSWGQSVSVLCNSSVENDYTWYFSGLTSLQMHNIHFHDCPRPLRIDTVAEVEITNCSFRSVCISTYGCYQGFPMITLCMV